MSKKPEQTGYGRPPVSGQFKKGQSGNPKGRPRGARNKAQTEIAKLVDVVAHEAEREIPTGSNGEVLSVKQAATRAILFKAVKGSAHAQRHAIQLIKQSEQAQSDARQEKEMRASSQWDLFGHLKNSLTLAHIRADTYGLPLPKELCHPDQIRFDMDCSEIVICHPVGQREEGLWRAFWVFKHAITQEIALLSEDQLDPRFCEDAEAVLEPLLQAHECLLELVNQALKQIWGVLPQDMLGPPGDVDEAQEVLVAAAGRALEGRAILPLALLRDLRRRNEVRHGKLTEENAAMHASPQPGDES